MIAVPPFVKTPEFRQEGARSFAKGMGFLGIFLIMLFGWVFLRSGDTLDKWQERFPSKTAIIQKQGEQLLGLRADEMETPAEEKIVTTPPEQSFFNKFKKPVTLADGMARLAIVFTDMGIADSFSRKAIDESHPAITLSFSPYSDELSALKTAADKKGFESWLMLPLQTQDYPAQDPGPMTILTNAPLELTQDQIDRFTGIAKTGYPGFVTNGNHMFALEDLRTNPMMRTIATQGFGFIEGKSEGNAFARDFSKEYEIPYAQANEWLQRNMGRSDIETVLQRLEKLTQMNGSAVLMVESTPVSLDIINEWIETLPEKKIQIVPLSAIAQ